MEGRQKLPLGITCAGVPAGLGPNLPKYDQLSPSPARAGRPGLPSTPVDGLQRGWQGRPQGLTSQRQRVLAGPGPQRAQQHGHVARSKLLQRTGAGRGRGFAALADTDEQP